MVYDVIAYWNQNVKDAEDLEDIYCRFKFLLTRDSVDGKKYYQTNVKKYSFPKMNAFTPFIASLENFPMFSFFLQIHFKLATPFISKDDDVFHIGDNPVRKDKVYKVPVIAASTWKGNLRWTVKRMREMGPDGPDDQVIIRLFGNERAERKEFHQGRLYFYPTFFYQIGLEVINPHDRKTKAGTLPIYLECVPAGAEGNFCLLYVPYDIMVMPEEIRRDEFEEDLHLILKSLREMMLTYGFAAKKSSGYGTIRDEFKEGNQKGGYLRIKSILPGGAGFANFTELTSLYEKAISQEGR